MNYEAGALTVGVENSKVIPIAFSLMTTDIPQPLGRFQSLNFSKNEIEKLISSLNNSYPTDQINEAILKEILNHIGLNLKKRYRLYFPLQKLHNLA